MRTELRLYAEVHPLPRWKTWLISMIVRVRLYFFMRRITRIELGSPRWHKIQEELSHRSSVGLDSLMRNLFFSKTLPECGDNLFVHPLTLFYYPKNVRLGNDVFINRGAIFMAPVGIKIGNNVLIGPYTLLNSGSHLYTSKSRLIDDQGHKYGEIVIEDDVWIGGHVCILPGVTISRGAVVAAGAVVNKSVSPYTVVGGVPAEVIGRRDGP